MLLQAKSPTAVKLKVYRRTPELVVPAKPTPHEFKQLSDLENLECYRIQIPSLMFYSHNPSMDGVDPCEVIKKAIAETLVFYYPFAGRLREECTSGRLVVECTGEGVLFTEAYADVTLSEFGYPLAPPFPCLDQLLFDVPGSNGILDSPLVLVQVTRLKCGGFIFGIRCNHTMCDASGAVEFMSTIGEMARGRTSPSTLPVWERHILNSTNPKKLTTLLLESSIDISEKTDDDPKFPLEHDLCYRAFFLGPTEISTLKKHVPPHLRGCSSFEIVTASVWKCRVVAFQPHPMEETTLIWSVNLRNKFKLPIGYYGNAAMAQMSKSTAKEIIENPLSYTLKMVRNAKNKAIKIEDYAQTLANIKINNLSYSVSDWRYAGFEKVDFGWGEAVYGGPDYCGPIAGCHLPYKNRNGENGIMLPLCLPKQVMRRFEEELNHMLKDHKFSRIEDVFQSRL